MFVSFWDNSIFCFSSSWVCSTMVVNSEAWSSSLCPSDTCRINLPTQNYYKRRFVVDELVELCLIFHNQHCLEAWIHLNFGTESLPFKVWWRYLAFCNATLCSFIICMKEFSPSKLVNLLHHFEFSSSCSHPTKQRITLSCILDIPLREMSTIKIISQGMR